MLMISSARRAKAQAQAQKNDVATEQPSEPSPSAQTESPEDDEPPLKKSKRMASGSTFKSKSSRASKSKSPLHTPVTRSASKQKAVEQEASAASTDDEIGDEDSQVTEDSGAESPAGYSAFEYGEESDESEGRKAPEGNYQDFLLSKTKLKKSDIVEVNDQYVCIRLKLRSTLAVLGHYDLNVRRGVISISGAKLQASPKRHRVYAPSTHSLPIIKAVSGIDDTAEVELHSISDDVYNLKRLSPLYERIGNGEQRVAKGPLKDHGPFSFSITLSKEISDPYTWTRNGAELFRSFPSVTAI
ncbi:Polynucleotide 5'-hydroxyl-kinase grc3 [Ascosphaera atra]|nr:Polynucleotide 5'-hydroxyl-kinase grc3 [Ascosphaera atra]